LRQVLLNLLGNAVKFTERGEVRLIVRRLSASGGVAWLRFEVRDTGIGVAGDALETIFKPFEQAGDKQHRLGGTGLGLAISRQLVRFMGSDIHVESREGQGSRFWFELGVPIPLAEAPRSQDPNVVTGYRGSRKTVLVIDDIRENRVLVNDLLSPLGFRVVQAEDGQRGLECAEQHRPDLILMDNLMPVMDGLEATRRLRETPAFIETPIITISASVSMAEQQRSLAAGANAFLAKPLDLTMLFQEISALLQLNWTYAGQKED
jgi:CheY-like chemotaxis protein